VDDCRRTPFPPWSSGSDLPDQCGGSSAHVRADASWAQRRRSGVATGGARDGVDPCGEEAAEDTLTPTLLHHSYRTYRFGRALGEFDGLGLDDELLFAAAILHDTGLMNPPNGSDFTLSSMRLAREIADRVGASTGAIEVIQTAIAMHYNPGVTTAAGTEAYLLSAGAA
jgi:hypothetical protein